MNNMYIWMAVAVISLVTALLRFCPFIVFKNENKTPKLIDKLGKMLPYAIMGMLVVYCLKGISFSSVSGFLPSLIACLVVGVLYIIKRNTLISIVCGTLCYMFLVQVVFK